MPRLQHDDQRHDRKDRQHETNAGIERPQHHQDADQQEDVADDLDDELGEETGDRRDITVNALDQLAGRVVFVERGVQRETVQSKIGAQSIGGGPCDALAEVGGADQQHLLCDGCSQEQRRDQQQLRLWRTADGAIHEHANELWADHLHGDAQQEQG